MDILDRDTHIADAERSAGNAVDSSYQNDTTDCERVCSFEGPTEKHRALTGRPELGESSAWTVHRDVEEA